MKYSFKSNGLQVFLTRQQLPQLTMKEDQFLLPLLPHQTPPLHLLQRHVAQKHLLTEHPNGQTCLLKTTVMWRLWHQHYSKWKKCALLENAGKLTETCQFQKNWLQLTVTQSCTLVCPGQCFWLLLSAWHHLRKKNGSYQSGIRFWWPLWRLSWISYLQI